MMVAASTQSQECFELLAETFRNGYKPNNQQATQEPASESPITPWPENHAHTTRQQQSFATIK
jgi:hypothetical protein